METQHAKVKIQSLIVPMRLQNLLVPQSALVEVVSMPEVRPLQSVPDWIRGLLVWRDREVPLVSLERFCDLLPEQTQVRTRRVAVLNGLLNLRGLDSFAIEIQGIPHPVRLGESDIRPQAPYKSCDLIAQYVLAAGVKCFILDHGELERRLHGAIASEASQSA